MIAIRVYAVNAALTMATFLCLPALALGSGTVPLIYSSDLYHPHGDPDDHFDLMTLFALPEFDIRAIVVDMGEGGKGRPGIPALKQLLHLTGRDVPYATGLLENLRSPEDQALEQPQADQAAVQLVLKALHEAQAAVTIFTTGSLRDMAAAFNREPSLFREKVARFYVNAGWVGEKMEWNVQLDPRAYVRILESGLPLYWAPCFGEEGYGTLWSFRHEAVLASCAAPIRNFFLYMLTKADPKQTAPIAFLHGEVPKEAVAKFWPLERRMWCTGPFLHAAGRIEPSFTFKKLDVSLRSDGHTPVVGSGQGLALNTFHVEDPEAYPKAMTEVLRQLFTSLALTEQAD